MYSCATEFLSVAEVQSQVSTTSSSLPTIELPATSVTSVSLDLSSASYRSQRHPIHYYDDGNIIIVVEDVIFKLHKSHSMTFGGMFSVFARTGLVDPLSEEVQTVPLHDDLDTFVGVLDALYCGLSFTDDLPIRHCLNILETSRKYEMGSVERCCQRHLVRKLPTSAVDPLENWRLFQSYYKDADLASLALRICPEYLAPWAFYMFTVHTLSRLNITSREFIATPPPSLDSMDKFTVYQMLVLQHANQKALAKWNSRIDAFYSSKCPRASSSRDKCARAHSVFDRRLPLFIPYTEDTHDPLKLIVPRIKKHVIWKGSTHDSSRNYWCYHCSTSLKDLANEVILDIYNCLAGSTSELGFPRGTPICSPTTSRANSPIS
ncbi:hypothetical protein FRC08_002588 [Ceratobasidium sp. 394]|nr:hypothetical protein FRC08_002588 [Ceratobasidium sp. 394]